VFKHANFGGTGTNCGAIILGATITTAKVPPCRTRAICLYERRSAGALSVNIQEFLEFGLHAFSMSRLSGCWVALKLVTNLCVAVAW
jgi:indolepyruvate ferredoxin oxidoreductase